MLPAIVTTLLGQGLSLLANATLVKGKDWLKEKTGIDVDAGSMSSDDMLKLRQFEMDHEAELLQLKLDNDKLAADIEKSYLADVQSARAMQIAALTNEDKFSKRFVYYFASFWSIFTAIFIFGITFFTVPDSSTRFADTVLGFLLGTVIAQILAYFFGSTKQSQTKDDTLSKAVNSITKDKQ